MLLTNINIDIFKYTFPAVTTANDIFTKTSGKLFYTKCTVCSDMS